MEQVEKKKRVWMQQKYIISHCFIRQSSINKLLINKQVGEKPLFLPIFFFSFGMYF